MSKNIVVLSDGTGQDGGRGHDTNVYKLFRMLEDRTDKQIVFYDQGLGTDWRKVTGNAMGAGFTKNILQCYRFIYDNYEAGDKIFLLGFSRGAATVRSLANFIHYFGILPKARPELIKRAWKIYKAGRRDRTEEKSVEGERKSIQQRTYQFLDNATSRVEAVFRESLNDQADKFVREHPNQWASIEFLGVWDTVPALGLVPLAGLNVLINNIPWWKHRFHDFKLHESVRNAYHALAIDDDRLWFHPTVWKECSEEQNVQQVWFSGSHTDVGGGFMASGLADVSLEWMVDKAVNHGIRMYMNSRSNWNFVIAPDPTDRVHPPRAGFGVIYKKGLRNIVWDQKTFDSYGPPKIHASVYDRMKSDPDYKPWIIELNNSYMRQLPEKFEEWLQAQYVQGFDKAAEENAAARRSDSDAMPEELPENRAAWMAQNPYHDWRNEKCPHYSEKISEGLSGEGLVAWLKEYSLFQEFLKDTYAPFEETEYGTLMIEPYSSIDIFKYKDKKGRIFVKMENMDSDTCSEMGLTNEGMADFRDYDETTLKDMLDKGFETSNRGERDRLLERVNLPQPIAASLSPVYGSLFKAIGSGLAGIFRKKQKPKTWEKRYKYDKERWY